MVTVVAIAVFLISVCLQFVGVVFLKRRFAPEVHVFLTSLLTVALFLTDAVLFSWVFPDGTAPGPALVAITLLGERFTPWNFNDDDEPDELGTTVQPENLTRRKRRRKKGRRRPPVPSRTNGLRISLSHVYEMACSIALVGSGTLIMRLFPW